jgi:hypothetical protein
VGALRDVEALVGFLELVVEPFDVVLEPRKPASQLLELTLQLEPSAFRFSTRTVRWSSSSRAPAAAISAAVTRSRATATLTPSSGTTCSIGGQGSVAAATWPATSGTAQTAATSSSESPVEANAVTTSPLRTTSAARGSSMAAVSIAST